MGDDDVKRLILARRARFVAAALAAAACGGSTVGTSSGTGNPEPCLDPKCETPDCNPQPCLSQVRDAGPADTGTDGPKDGSDDADDAGPQPCLVPPLDGG